MFKLTVDVCHTPMNHRSVLCYLLLFSLELFFFFLKVQLIEDLPDDKSAVVKDSEACSDQEESQIAQWRPNHVLELLVYVLGER